MERSIRHCEERSDEAISPYLSNSRKGDCHAPSGLAMTEGGVGRGAAERPGGEPWPSLASAASRRVGPCTRSAVQRSCTGWPGAASASVTLGRRADPGDNGPPPTPPPPRTWVPQHQRGGGLRGAPCAPAAPPPPP